MPRIREIDLLPGVPAGGYVVVTQPVPNTPGWSVFGKIPSSALGGGGPGGGFVPSGTTSQLLDGTGLNVSVGSGLTLNPATHTLSASGTAGVASFNTRTGAVTLASADVTTALTYTPYNATNPSNYVNAAGAASAAPVQSVANRGGAVSLTHNDITDWSTTLSPYALTSNVPGPAVTNPIVNGAVSIGSLTTYAKADHIHPTDTSRASTAVATVSTPGLVKPDGTSIVIDGTGKITSTVSGGFTPGGTVAQLLSGTGSNVTVGSGLTLTSGTLTAAGGGPALPGGTANQIQFNSAGTALGGFTMSGDATLNVSTGAITVTKANGATISTTYAPIASPTFTGTATAPNYTIQNAGSLNLLDTAGGSPHLTVQADNNMVLFGTDGAGASRALLSAVMRSANSPLTFYSNITTNSGPLTLTNGRFLSVANGGNASVAVSDGTTYSGMFVNGTGLAWGPTDSGASPTTVWASLASTGMTVSNLTVTGGSATQLLDSAGNKVTVSTGLTLNNTTHTLTASASGFTPGGTTSQLLDGTGLNVTVGSGLTLNPATHTLSASGTAGVASFNTRTGAVTLSSSDVTTALTYTPASIAGPTFTGTVTTPNLTVPNGGSLNLPDASGGNPHLIVQPDNNMVLFGTDSAGAARALLAVGMHSSSSALLFNTPLSTISGPLTLANGRFLSIAGGGAGCIAVSDGVSYNGMFINGTGLAWGPTSAAGDPAAIWATLTATGMTLNGVPVATTAVATNSTPGLVKPDGTTITVDVTGKLTSIGGVASAGGSSGQIQWNNAGSLAGFAMSGDATLTASTGAITLANSTSTRNHLGIDKVAFDVDFSQGAVVVNGTITVIRKAPFAFTINSMDYEVGSAAGSFTVGVQVNGANVTGLAAVAVSSATSANAAATATNTVAAGQAVTLVITGTSGAPTGANLQINGTR